MALMDEITSKALAMQMSYMVEKAMILYKEARVQTQSSVRMEMISSSGMRELILYSVGVETHFTVEKETIIFMAVLTPMFFLEDQGMTSLTVVKGSTLLETLIPKRIQQVLTVSY